MSTLRCAERTHLCSLYQIESINSRQYFVVCYFTLVLLSFTLGNFYSKHYFVWIIMAILSAILRQWNLHNNVECIQSWIFLPRYLVCNSVHGFECSLGLIAWVNGNYSGRLRTGNVFARAHHLSKQSWDYSQLQVIIIHSCAYVALIMIVTSKECNFF